MDADLDELWIRAEYANGETSAQIESDQNSKKRHGEMSAGIDGTGTMVAESRVNGETVSKQKLKPDRNHSFNSLFSQTIGRQLHLIIDQYIPVNLNVLDSVVAERLNNRFIYPEFVSTEVVWKGWYVAMSIHQKVAPMCSHIVIILMRDCHIAFI